MTEFPGSHAAATPAETPAADDPRALYRATFLALKTDLASAQLPGSAFLERRSAAVDALVSSLWQSAASAHVRSEVALIATGGYGRKELFPYSDVDLLFVAASAEAEAEAKPAIRSLGQQMWDAGIRFSPVTRRVADLDRFDPTNLEFGLSLLDRRPLLGHTPGHPLLNGLGDRLTRNLEKDHRTLSKGLIELTRARHAKYGNTLFHLEPNIKDCPGGLRDVHVCHWIALLEAHSATDPLPTPAADFAEAAAFLTDLRCFLHLRHERDDNTLDWRAQDEAAERRIGLPPRDPASNNDRTSDRNPDRTIDAAYWMRLYFRNARTVERAVTLSIAGARPRRVVRQALGRLSTKRRDRALPAGFETQDNQVMLRADAPAGLTSDADAVLGLFVVVSQTGTPPAARLEADLVSNLPRLAARLEDGAALWHRLRAILVGRYAGTALRSMHAVGLLDLLIPEFHGIDALVIRDAYHRYTVDEHTFVAIDTLHSLETLATPDDRKPASPAAEWSARFGQLLAELPHPDLLFLATLMHDTGKGRSTGEHTHESARLTAGLLSRLELDAEEIDAVLGLIRNHLEMSATLRRDIFDAETIRTFAGTVKTQDTLRMLVLFTYADLNAVHPDALTPWKAENLWRLYIATSNHLDRSVDDERVTSTETELVARVAADLPGESGAVAAFLEGFPERYVRTRSADQIRQHFRMAGQLTADPVQLSFRYAPAFSEIVLLTRDRESLFADVAGALAAWGMNIVTADAFSNGRGIVVDSFRFTDSFQTLELNESERDRFVRSVHDVINGQVSVEKLLGGRRSPRRTLRAPSQPRFRINNTASSHSTLLEVVMNDSPGLLRALSLSFAAAGCNIEVALVDTEGETAIDVFYLTRAGRKIDDSETDALLAALADAVRKNEVS